MTKQNYNRWASYMNHKIAEAREAGQKEYANEDNIFADFDNAAELTGVSREKVLFIFLNKHIRGISSYLKGHTSQREHVTGRIKDAIVYLKLLWAMIDENEKMELSEMAREELNESQ